MRRFAALPVLVTLAAIVTSCQLAPPAENWGEPIDGVQLRLAVATADLPPTPPGELPAFELRIRNRGSSAVTVMPDLIDCAEIEIDGVWYTQICFTTGNGRLVDIAPGSQSDVMRMRPNGSIMFELHAKPAPRAGPHRVRVRNAVVYAVRADKKAGFVQRWLKLVSNRITIDIPASAAISEPWPEQSQVRFVPTKIDSLPTKLTEALLEFDELSQGKEVLPEYLLVARVDLNGDSKSEYIVQSAQTHSGGLASYIFESRGERFVKIANCAGGIYLASPVNGYAELVCQTRGGGGTFARQTFRYQGNQYQLVQISITEP